MTDISAIGPKELMTEFFSNSIHFHAFGMCYLLRFSSPIARLGRANTWRAPSSNTFNDIYHPHKLSNWGADMRIRLIFM